MSGRTLGAPAVLGALVVGAIVGGMAVKYWMTRSTGQPTAQSAQAPAGDLAADVGHLKNVLPTQSHTMQDVGYHWSSLWFAAERKNWPLAEYYFSEARQAIRWTILIRPVRQLPGGGTVNIKGIFDAVDPSAFAAVQLAIEDKDVAAFTSAYKQANEACYTCHTASGKPYLRVVVPTAPPSTLISPESPSK